VLTIKNVILYDPYASVVGFVELKNYGGGKTKIRVKDNLADADLTLTINGQIYNMTDQGDIDLEKEIRVSITQRNGNTTTTIASGELNINQPFSKSLATLPPLKAILQDINTQSIDRTSVDKVEGKSNSAVREIDEILRAVCTVDDKGKGICEMCPYREFFFGENITG